MANSHGGYTVSLRHDTLRFSPALDLVLVARDIDEQLERSRAVELNEMVALGHRPFV